MDEWEFQRAFAVGSDNATNVVLALNESTRVQHLVSCIEHTSQLAINDSLKSIQLITHAVAVMRGLAKFFQRSGPRWNKLKEVQWSEIQDNKKKQSTRHASC